MKRLRHLPGILLTGATTGYSVVEGNLVGTVVFGVLTLLLLWFAVRPERPKSKAFHPLRGIVAIAAGFSVLAAAMVLGVVFAEDQRSRGLAAVSAVVGVPGALYSWWLVRRGWKKGYRWSTTATEGELERLRGRPEEGPS